MAFTKNVVQEEIAAEVMERALANGSVDQTKFNVNWADYRCEAWTQAIGENIVLI